MIHGQQNVKRILLYWFGIILPSEVACAPSELSARLFAIQLHCWREPALLSAALRLIYVCITARDIISEIGSQKMRNRQIIVLSLLVQRCCSDVSILLTAGNTFHTKIETYVSSDIKAAVAILGGGNENKIVICTQFILFTIYYEKIKDVLHVVHTRHQPPPHHAA
jgi:hypothetical protein